MSTNRLKLSQNTVTVEFTHAVFVGACSVSDQETSSTCRNTRIRKFISFYFCFILSSLYVQQCINCNNQNNINTFQTMCIYYDQFTVCDQLQHSSSSRVTLYLPVPIINIKFYKKCKNSNSIVSLFLMKLGIDGDPIFTDLVVPDN